MCVFLIMETVLNCKQPIHKRTWTMHRFSMKGVVLVCNNAPQTGRLKGANWFSQLWRLEVQTRGRQGGAPSDTSQGQCCLDSSKLLVASCAHGLVSISECLLRVCMCFDMVSFSNIYFFSYKEWLYLTLITSVKTLFPNKVPFISLGG